MKKFVLALVLLLCLLAGSAMAENVIYLDDVTEMDPGIENMRIIYITEDTVLRQRAEKLDMIYMIYMQGPHTVTLDGVQCRMLYLMPHVSAAAEESDIRQMTLRLKGTNKLYGGDDVPCNLALMVPAVVDGDGTLMCSGAPVGVYSLLVGEDAVNLFAVKNGTVEISSSQHAVGDFLPSEDDVGAVPGKVELLNAALTLQCGESKATAAFADQYKGEKYLKISKEQPPVPEVPKTGDGMNLALMAVLACIGMAGVMILSRKKNEA